ncbi:ubiquitin-conjugating enzyme E2 C [Strigomonas culicis]|nr:ubiquitin-conjugating enzyme E2 C [Strigomonas culicis]|eukprot:EPY36980.1 ubiquitin-conjugating enzyme E2 C [Strigomonas culicis]
MELMMGGAEGISAFPYNDDLFHWIGTVQGVDHTPYEGMEFQLSIVFSPNYPFEAPQVTFVTPCFHPNVDTHGAICLDILKEKWSAVYSASAILLSIQNLLNHPNNQSPLNNQAALMWGNTDEYRRAVQATYGMGTRAVA